MFQKVIYNKQNAQAIVSGKKDTIYTNMPSNVISSMEKAFNKMTRGKHNIMLRMIYSHWWKNYTCTFLCTLPYIFYIKIIFL